MKLNLSGLTAVGVLVTAIVAGGAGGALALSASQGHPVPPPAVTLHQVADEPTAEPTPAPVVAESPPPAPVVDQAPVADVGGSGETATQAADRAVTAADRADDAATRASDSADRASSAPAPDPAPAPVPAPKEDPVVAKPDPNAGTVVVTTPPTVVHGHRQVDPPVTPSGGGGGSDPAAGQGD